MSSNTGHSPGFVILSTWLALTVMPAAMLCGCHTGRHGFLVNAGNATLKVDVSMPSNAPGSDMPSKDCHIDRNRQPIMIGPVELMERRKLQGWLPVPLTSYDADACSATFNLPPGLAALLYTDASCGDRREADPNAVSPPTMERLTVLGGTSPIHFSGRDVRSAFRHSGRYGDCVFVVR